MITDGPEKYPSMGKHDSLIHQIDATYDEENKGSSNYNNNDCYKISFVEVKNLNINTTSQR